MTWSNPACNVLVGDNSEITAAKSTVPDTKSNSSRAKASTPSTSSAAPSQPASSQTSSGIIAGASNTGSNNSIGGKEISSKFRQSKRIRRNVIPNAPDVLRLNVSSLIVTNQTERNYGSASSMTVDAIEGSGGIDDNDNLYTMSGDGIERMDFQRSQIIDDGKRLSERATINAIQIDFDKVESSRMTNDQKMANDNIVVKTDDERKMIVNDVHVTHADNKRVSHNNNNAKTESPIGQTSAAFDDSDGNIELIANTFDEFMASEIGGSDDQPHLSNAMVTLPEAFDAGERIKTIVVDDTNHNSPSIQTNEMNRKRDDQSNDNFVNSLQNDGPAVIVRYESAPIGKDKENDEGPSGIEQSASSVQIVSNKMALTTTESIRDDTSPQITNDANNVNRIDLEDIVNQVPEHEKALGQTIPTTVPPNQNTNMQPQSAESNADRYKFIDMATAIKTNEPHFEMLDGAHNRSIASPDVRNVPRILVNVSIATDLGDGTQHHGVYMLHVSVPASPDLLPQQHATNIPQPLIPMSQMHIAQMSQTLQSIEHKTNASDSTTSKLAQTSSISDGEFPNTNENLCDTEISRLQSVIEQLNQTMERMQSNISNHSDALIGNNVMENLAVVTVAAESTTAETVTENEMSTTLSLQDNDDNNLGDTNWCNREIPPILILEGESVVCQHENTITIIHHAKTSHFNTIFYHLPFYL